MDKIAVLIPCYNEEKTVQKVVSDWKKALPEASIYVYDNCSTDDTARLALESGAILRHEYQQGKGNVVRRMFREIDAMCYILVDGDDTYPAEAGPALCEEVLSRSADMVVGDRLSSTYFTENKRRFHNSGNTLVRFFINSLYGSNIQDIMTGLRAFSFQFVKGFPALSTGFEIETEMTIHAVDKNLRVSNIVIDYRDRPAGSSSKLNTIPDGIRVLRTIFTLFRSYRPLPFFGCIALVLTLLSAVFFVPIFFEFLRTGLVLKFPTLIVCGFAEIAAICAFFAGLVLDNINKATRQEFEFRLQQIDRDYKLLMQDTGTPLQNTAYTKADASIPAPER